MGKGPRPQGSGSSYRSHKSKGMSSFSENSNDSIRTAESMQEARAMLRERGLMDGSQASLQSLSQPSYNSDCTINSSVSLKEELAEKFATKFRLSEVSAAPSGPGYTSGLSQAAAQPSYMPGVPPLPVLAEEIPFGDEAATPHSDVPMLTSTAPPSPTRTAQGSKPSRRGGKKVHKTVKKEHAGTSRRGPEQLTQEQWEDRQKKWKKAIEKLMSNPIFWEFENSLYAQGKRPEPPNHSDRSLSKRDWEAKVFYWRDAWRKIHGVSSLLEKGFPEQESEAAWDAAGQQIERSKAQAGNTEEHAAFQERLQKEHIQLAVAILVGGA